MILILCQCTGDRNTTASDSDFTPRTIPVTSGQGNHVMVVSMGGNRSVQAGLDILAEGGNALDAVLATSMTHIVSTIGMAVSFGGTISLVYYDAETGDVYSMNGPFKIPQRETDPLSIPGRNSGRTALVPGFLPGVLAAHQRWGRIAIEKVFEPAIELAEAGFSLPSWMAAAIRSNYYILSRLPETKKIFTKSDGSLYEADELFTQPDLAATLRQVVIRGPDYIYTGQWAQKFVDIVSSDGGNVRMDDMAAYRINWNPAVTATFNGYDIYGIGLPAPGGVGIAEAFNLIKCSDLSNDRRYTETANDLYQMIKIVRVGPLYRNFLNASDVAETKFPGSDFSQQSRLTMETARYTWSKIVSGEWSQVELIASGKRALNSSNAHTSAEIVVDREGNVAAMVHTINTNAWGQTGIFVGGISIPDIGYGARYAIAIKGPGGYHYDDICPGIVMRDGRPVLACGSAGYGLHSDTIQNIYNILAHGDSPAESLARHKVLYAHWWQNSSFIPQLIWERSFSDQMLQQIRDMGQQLHVVSDRGQVWAGIKMDWSGNGNRLLGGTTLGSIGSN